MSDEVRLDRSLFDEAPSGASGEPLGAYVACALTHVSSESHCEMERHCDDVKSTLAELGFDTHLPKDYTDPKRDGDLPPGHVNQVDYDAVLASELLVFLGEYPTTGGGKELVWAERNGASVLVLVPPGMHVSRLVTGTTCDLEERIFASDEELKQRIVAFVTPRLPLFRARAAKRAEVRSALEPVRASLLATEAIDTEGITSSRRAEILRTPAQLENASIRELLAAFDAPQSQELLDALVSIATGSGARSESRGLDHDEIDKLLLAAELRAWSTAEVAILVTTATQERLLSTGKRRLRFLDVESWEALHSDLF